MVDHDDGPEISLDFEAMEAATAMDDFQEKTFLVEEEPTNLQSMIAKLNADQKRVFDIITKKMDITDNNTDVLRCYVSGTGGTVKSSLTKTLKVWVKTKQREHTAARYPTHYTPTRYIVHRGRVLHDISAGLVLLRASNDHRQQSGKKVLDRHITTVPQVLRAIPSKELIG
ncbi:hypothetical protein EVAR_32789_1 [Eumeta japonica]|uniref:ATP-dependent DNA helicase n=1 Tax=Eumeta variegata TaxID=151549 RepID=A0A4C1WEB5_EUMVA|nr:hypothetical protein EVAR_32789_1 [Eumeta japonica]